MKKNRSNMTTACAISALLVTLSATTLFAQDSKTIPPAANEFKTVTIGTQQWMAENLNIGTFRNGEPIPDAKTKVQWEAVYKNEAAAWCYYNNDPANGKKFGRPYNWYTVNDPRGLCPAGWHVPSDKEWTVLVSYLGGENAAVPKMKSSTGWNGGGSGNNSSGFTGLHGGEEVSTIESPFGIFGPYVTINEDKPTGISKTDVDNYLKDVGAGWVQEMPKDSDLDEVSKSGVNIYSRIGISKEQTREAVKKYKDTVKYWEAGTEPDGVGGWKDDPTGYVAFLEDMYTIVKEECPDCYLVPGGLGGVGTGLTEDSVPAKFLKGVLQAGGGKYFDVFEFKQHAWNADDYPELKNKMAVYGKIFADYGIDIKTMPVFVETATHDGNPRTHALITKEVSQSEVAQASGVIKIYVYGLVQGIDKIFWNLVVERHNFANDPYSSFNFYGLVNNPDNDGQSHKKLSYYTYKKMVEVLDGSDWSSIQTFQEEDGVYVYKFTKQEKPIWVAWNDNSGSKKITIDAGNTKTVTITEAIPKYETGKEVTNYNTAFHTKTKSVSGDKLKITLRDKPVFVEGQ